VLFRFGDALFFVLVTERKGVCIIWYNGSRTMELFLVP
jgi:hypothetical protein